MVGQYIPGDDFVWGFGGSEGDVKLPENLPATYWGLSFHPEFRPNTVEKKALSLLVTYGSYSHDLIRLAVTSPGATF